MTAHKDLDTVLDAFFAEGPSEIADDVIEASLRLIDTTDQRRAGFGSRRTRSMSTLTRFSIAAAAVLTVAVLGTIVLPGLSRTAGTSPAPTTSPRAIAVAPSINVSSGVPSSAPSASAADALLAPLGYAAGGTILFTRSVPELPDQLSVSTIRPDGTGETPLRIDVRGGRARRSHHPDLLRHLLAGRQADRRRRRGERFRSRPDAAHGCPDREPGRHLFGIRSRHSAARAHRPGAWTSSPAPGLPTGR